MSRPTCPACKATVYDREGCSRVECLARKPLTARGGGEFGEDEILYHDAAADRADGCARKKPTNRE